MLHYKLVSTSTNYHPRLPTADDSDFIDVAKLDKLLESSSIL